jgi:electron transport complex protein RnfG
MKDNLKLGVILAIITTIAGLLLGIVHESTKEAIAANSKMTKEQIAAVMPIADKVNSTDEVFDKDSTIQEVFKAYKGENLVGYLVKVNSKGFHGNIELLVGISKEQEVTGINILSHSETPGVGSKIEKQEFEDRFRAKSILEALKLVKTSTTKATEVEGIAGATVSSSAVVKGVNDAVNYINQNLSSEGGK